MMKTITIALGLITLLSVEKLSAQNSAIVEAKSDEISNNLDLELVATLFGEAEDLADFEFSLNNPNTRISNLDLNDDGEVDYLRVVANSSDDAHLISIQAVLGFDNYQDVATIDVVKNSSGDAQVQVVGDEYIYGSNYIFSMVFDILPDIIDFLWNMIFRSWQSPYSYNNYPAYYQPCVPYTTQIYAQNVLVQVNTYNVYIYTTVRESETCKELQYKQRRYDFEKSNPEKSFAYRNPGIKNKYELNRKKTKTETKSQKISEIKTSTGKKVLKEWKPASELSGSTSLVKDNTATVSMGNTFIKPKENTSNNTLNLNKTSKGSSNQNTWFKSSGNTSTKTYKSTKSSSSRSGSSKSTYKPSSTKSTKTYKSNKSSSGRSGSSKSTYKPSSKKSTKTYKSNKSSSNRSGSSKSTYKPADRNSKSTNKPKSKTTISSVKKKKT